MALTYSIKNGDIMVSAANGRPVTISGMAKTSQDISEFFTVDIQPNGFGAGIEQLIGVLSSGSSLTGVVDRQIIDGINDLIRLQRVNAAIPRTNDELIIGVTDVQTIQDTSDATKYYFTANVVTASGKVYPVVVGG
jgi:hypothetical protein